MLSALGWREQDGVGGLQQEKRVWDTQKIHRESTPLRLPPQPEC